MKSRVSLTFNYEGPKAEKLVIGRLHMTSGLQTGMQTRCPYRFANGSSCVNGQIHCLQTGRRPDRKNQTCFAIRQPTRAMCKRSRDRYDDRFANWYVGTYEPTRIMSRAKCNYRFVLQV